MLLLDCHNSREERNKLRISEYLDLHRIGYHQHNRETPNGIFHCDDLTTLLHL